MGVTRREWISSTPVRFEPRARPRTGWTALAVVLLVVLGFLLRASQLGAAGFSEDELEKYDATTAYARHTFTDDGEHPMLMKLGIWMSRSIARIVASSSGGRWAVSDEALVRLPNAAAGALTTGACFLLGSSLFGPATGLVAAALWTVDINAIAINRIGKEDSLLVLFLVLAAWLYERGKAVGRFSPEAAQRWFRWSGAAWGLMLASKYMPYYLGIHTVFFRLADPHPGRNAARYGAWFAAMGLAFVLANPAALHPDVWAQVLGFFGEHRLSHNGYFFDGRIWSNRVSDSPFGLPLTFYPLAMLTKVPLPTLIAACIGLVALALRPRSRGALFVLVFLILTLVPYSIVASKFLRYLLPVWLLLDLAAAVGVLASARAVARASRAHGWAVAILTGVVVVASAWAWTRHPGHPSLYRNAIGETLSPGVLQFAHDEVYDAGVREVAGRIAADAGRNALVYCEAVHVMAHYLVLAGRPDLRVETIAAAASRVGRLPPESDAGWGRAVIVPAGPEPSQPTSDEPDGADGTEAWWVVQDGRRYFESAAVVARLDRLPPTFTLTIDGFAVARAYHVLPSLGP